MVRHEEEIVGGFLNVTLGGERRKLPVLKIRESRSWKESLAVTLRDRVSPADFRKVDDVGSIGVLASDAILDLVLDYDRSNALGGREYVEEHGTDVEVYEILRGVWGLSFPFVKDLQGLMRTYGPLMAELFRGSRSQVAAPDPSPSENSTNGHSPNGDSIPRELTPV